MGIVNAHRPLEFLPRLRGTDRLPTCSHQNSNGFGHGNSSASGLARPDKAQSRKEQGDQAQAAKKNCQALVATR
jgi:hypothetical protein